VKGVTEALAAEATRRTLPRITEDLSEKEFMEELQKRSQRDIVRRRRMPGRFRTNKQEITNDN
jgi:hypothetical protein